jgi:hypothetical protein
VEEVGVDKAGETTDVADNIEEVGDMAYRTQEEV